MSALVLAAGCAGFGAAAGMLLPRMGYRLSVPYGSAPRPACTACDGSFPAGWPGWIRLGRACRCPASPGPAPGWSALATAGAAAALGLGLRPPELPVYLIAAVFGVLLATVDLSCLRLPDPVVAALALATVLPLAAVAMITGQSDRLGRAALAGLLLFVVYLLVALLPGHGIGFGDVKLVAVLGFLLGWIGWPAVLLGSVAAHLVNGPVVLMLLVTGRAGRGTALPLGPALLAGTLLAVASYA